MKQMFGSILAVFTLCLSCSLAYGNILNQVKTKLLQDIPPLLAIRHIQYSPKIITNIADTLLNKLKEQLELSDSDNDDSLEVFLCFGEGGTIQAHISSDCTDIAFAEVFPVVVPCQ